MHKEYKSTVFNIVGCISKLVVVLLLLPCFVLIGG